jgi:monovalent cation:H+ antiporter-2, CPA2 family
MHLDPLLPLIVGVIAVVLIIGMLLQYFRQPQLVGYIITGVLIGPTGLAIVNDIALIEHLGAIGVTLLLFFIGMEVSPRQLVSGWRIAIFGTFFQIVISVATSWFIGILLDWTASRIVLLGFVISLSSTAVVLKLLKDSNELKTTAGQNVLLILLAQDLAIVPMLIIISMLSGQSPEKALIYKQLIGGIIITAFAIWVASRKHLKLPFAKAIKKDHELQLFSALLICFGFAFITAVLGLSAALGAFVAGLVIASAKETDWVKHALEPLRIVFVALLFVSMGMIIDVNFILENWPLLASLLFGILVTNTFINALILKVLGIQWAVSFYSGALLSQIGEFSFVLATVGLQTGLINSFSYQATIALIALSLLASPLWIQLSRKILAPYISHEATKIS